MDSPEDYYQLSVLIITGIHSTNFPTIIFL